jgi:hypothetical protein
MTNSTFSYKSKPVKKTTDREAHSLSTNLWLVLVADLQNPDHKHYAQSVLKRALERLGEIADCGITEDGIDGK